ncbi:MAG: hypothetical protein AAGF12_27935 [Myxococcota bacterium]
MSQHRFWKDDPACIVAAFRDHLSSTTVKTFHAVIREHQSDVVQRSCVGYIHEGTVTSRRALKAIGKMIGDRELRMDAWVCCIAGSGFWAATGRGMAASVMLAINPTAPVHLPATMEQTVRWLEKRGLPTPALEVQREVIAFGESDRPIKER